MQDETLVQAAHQLGLALVERSRMIATAESCTGGMIAMALTEVAGSSAWFDRGFVTYSNQAKTDLLQVPADNIEAFGAVSEQVAVAMALGALDSNPAASFSLSVTGIAGPGGGSLEKPVGTVVHGFAWRHREAADRMAYRVERCHYGGDRAAIRLATSIFALRQALFFLQTEC